MTRVGVNSTFGLFGVLDVASEMGLDHHYEDFGQTLGRWGVGAGAYVVLPLLGPSTVRDTAALVVDRIASAPSLIGGTEVQLGLGALQIVNTRAGLLGASRVLDDIALDKYTFVRDAYLQRRRSLVFDGEETRGSGGAGSCRFGGSRCRRGQSRSARVGDTGFGATVKSCRTGCSGEPPHAQAR